jgi:methylmalonyl-CoA mutase
MQVGAFDQAIRQPDDFSQRIARNTQLILQRECHLDHVIDPAGGSWLIETLTADLANRAWALFQEVEKIGGMESALRDGFPQKSVATTAAEKLKAVSRRRETIVGVNQYANPAEKPLDRPWPDAKAFHKRRVQQVSTHRTSLDDDESELVLERLATVVNLKGAELFEACIAAASSGATLGEITRAVRINDTPCQPITPVCITRAAMPFEQLRAATTRYSARTGQAPRVFLCNWGSLREYKARADFARGFFGTAGYEIVASESLKNPEQAAEAFVQSGAPIAVICSTDENYPTVVPPLVQALRAKQPKALVVLAGFPQDHIQALQRAGVDEFIHLRADAGELLGQFHSELGINS